MSKQQIYKSRFNTEMKQDEYYTARPTLKHWSNRNRTVEPLWARPKTEHRASANLIEKFLEGAFIVSEAPARPTRRRLIKDGSKVVNRDWVNHQACSLLHNRGGRGCVWTKARPTLALSVWVHLSKVIYSCRLLQKYRLEVS